MRYEKPQKRTCQLDLVFCFREEFLNPNVASIPMAQSRNIFHRLAFEEFHCGDCLLEILMQHPDMGGMAAWMPSDEASLAFQEVAAKVKRYNYVIGTSDYSFIALRDPEGSQRDLDGILKNKNNKVFLCINDDFTDDTLIQSQIHNTFKKFLDTRFPMASPWEKTLPN
jgi:hypothetical protein